MSSNEHDIFRRALAPADAGDRLPADFQVRLMERIAREREARERLADRLLTVSAIGASALLTGALVLAVNYFGLFDTIAAPLRQSLHEIFAGLAVDLRSPLIRTLLPALPILLCSALLILWVDTRRVRRQLRRQ